MVEGGRVGGRGDGGMRRVGGRKGKGRGDWSRNKDEQGWKEERETTVSLMITLPLHCTCTTTLCPSLPHIYHPYHYTSLPHIYHPYHYTVSLPTTQISHYPRSGDFKSGRYRKQTYLAKPACTQSSCFTLLLPLPPSLHLPSSLSPQSAGKKPRNSHIPYRDSTLTWLLKVHIHVYCM